MLTGRARLTTCPIYHGSHRQLVSPRRGTSDRPQKWCQSNVSPDLSVAGVGGQREDLNYLSAAAPKWSKWGPEPSGRPQRQPLSYFQPYQLRRSGSTRSIAVSSARVKATPIGTGAGELSSPPPRWMPRATSSNFVNRCFSRSKVA